MPVRGGTFLFRAGPGDFHLHICLTGAFDAANEIPQQVLLVSSSTVRGYRGEDSTCLLHPGEHPFIQAESYIAYSKWRCLTIGEIQRAEALGLALERESLAVGVFQRIRDGLFQSPRVPKCAQTFVLAYEETL